jgi:uncharacterized membrane protein HdeD (DUF308 family)
MVGMIQILIYLLGVYLIFKGIEIFQIALMSNRPNRAFGLIVGIVAIMASIFLAISFSYMGDKQAASMNTSSSVY